MSKSKTKEPAVVTVGGDRWGYVKLSAHLGVSVRTLKRDVVSGCIPQPVIIRNRAYWSGEKLVAARQGRQIPGTFDYTPNEREAKRTATIARKAAVVARAKRIVAGRKGAAKRGKEVAS